MKSDTMMGPKRAPAHAAQTSNADMPDRMPPDARGSLAQCAPLASTCIVASVGPRAAAKESVSRRAPSLLLAREIPDVVSAPEQDLS
jgi:hypothetical protein